jgi:hypothetical protein
MYSSSNVLKRLLSRQERGARNEEKRNAYLKEGVHLGDRREVNYEGVGWMISVFHGHSNEHVLSKL